MAHTFDSRKWDTVCVQSIFHSQEEIKGGCVGKEHKTGKVKTTPGAP